MPRLIQILVVLVAILGVGVAWIATRPAPEGLSEAHVRAIVTETLAQHAESAEAGAGLAPETLNPMIESYLLGNPRILQQVSEALDREVRSAAAAETRAALQSMHAQIYEDDDHVVLGNPDGDVTLVELFDYNCSYCRQALPDLATLLAEDPDLKVILMEFPILSQDSVDAARVAVLVNQAGADYWDFHQRLFSGRGQVTGATALAAAQEIGLNRVNLELEMSTPRVTATIEKSYSLARTLGITGTPTFIIGGEMIPGAIGLEGLRSRIANMRACGSTVCDSDGSS